MKQAQQVTTFVLEEPARRCAKVRSIAITGAAEILVFPVRQLLVWLIFSLQKTAKTASTLSLFEFSHFTSSAMITCSRLRSASCAASPSNRSGQAMASPAETAKRVHRDLGLLPRDADDVGASQLEEPLQALAPSFAFAALDYENQFDPRHC
jgi:hypothetical protein